MRTGRNLATMQFTADSLAETLTFLKRIRGELRTVCRARVFLDRVQIVDVNGDWFEIEGLGYADADIVTVLRAVNAAFKVETIHQPVAAEYKEFPTGRRYAWAADRVM